MYAIVNPQALESGGNADRVEENYKIMHPLETQGLAISLLQLRYHRNISSPASVVVFGSAATSIGYRLSDLYLTKPYS